MKILILEDEKALAGGLGRVLDRKGFTVETVCDGEAGSVLALTGEYDLLILDVMTRQMDGLEVLRRVREERPGTPIVMLTARPGVEERILGLNSGADYCLAKPVDIRELLACVNALLRRKSSGAKALSFGDTRLEPETCMLSCAQEKVRLTAKEFHVMRLLMSSGEQLLSKEVILARVWGFDSNAVENHVEVYVGFLRKKLKTIGSNVHIRAVKRMGYHLELGEPEALGRG